MSYGIYEYKHAGRNAAHILAMSPVLFMLMVLGIWSREVEVKAESCSLKILFSEGNSKIM